MPDVVTGRDPLGNRVASLEDRDRLTDAMTRAAVEGGYPAVEIEQIAPSARASRSDDFHRYFRDQGPVPAGGIRPLPRAVLEHIDEACEGARDWPEKVKLTIESAFEFAAELQGGARLFAVDAMCTGPAAVERGAARSTAAVALKHGRLIFPAAADMPIPTERTLVAGVVMIASIHLLAEEADELPEIAPEAVEMVLTPYIGPAQPPLRHRLRRGARFGCLAASSVIARGVGECLSSPPWTGKKRTARRDAQRERLIDAFTRIAAERGYAKTTVREVAAVAGLPQGVFYPHFSGKNQCLTAAYDSFVERRPHRGGGEATGAGVAAQVKEAVAAASASSPKRRPRARFFAVEAPAAARRPRALSSRRARIVFLLRSGRDHYPEAADLPELTEQVLVGGAACLVSSARAHEEQQAFPRSSRARRDPPHPVPGRDEARRIAA